ncbi:MAG: ABC transporter permease [Spirochaetes bacterium]|jgi:simple sugar transport system permease protein|nr:ABC transporter permease [Spirochaetota bacterium]
MSGSESRASRLPDGARTALLELGYSILAIIIAISIGAVLIVIFGYDVRTALASLFQGAFGSAYAISQTVLRTTPLVFAGLAVALAFRAGLFNIGAEGQLYWGALATAVAAIAMDGAPPMVAVGLPILAGALTGALWGSIPGILKARTGAHEVITSIMLNSIAVLGTTHVTSAYFKAPGAVDQTERIAATAEMPGILGSDISAGLLVGVVAIALFSWFLGKTSLGYDFRAVGLNASAAEYGGVRSSRIQVMAMSLGGAMAGIAGGMVVLSQISRFVANFSPGYGFTGIAVAVLGRGKPWGVLLAAFLFAVLETGGMSMQLFARIPSDLTTVIQGLVILLVAAPAALHALSRLRLRRRRDSDAG